MSKGRAIVASIFVALGVIAYGASPIDIIPEVIFGPLGLADDAALLIGAGFAIWKMLSGRNAPPSAPPQQPAPPVAEPPHWEQKATE
jgi:hypothetical protein